MMFYEIVIAVDGYAEARSMPVPKTHGAGRAVVGRHLPRLAKPYGGLCGQSLKAGHYDGYSMTGRAWRKAARCREVLANGIPVQ